MNKLLIVLFAVIALSLNTEARIFSRCELVRELRRQAFPANELRDWVCLAEAESARNTGFISPPNNLGQRGWGLFQIWDTFWCSNTNVAGGDCQVRCSDLITADITWAAKCARLIYIRHGFSAWFGWNNRCRGQTLPDISSC